MCSIVLVKKGKDEMLSKKNLSCEWNSSEKSIGTKCRELKDKSDHIENFDVPEVSILGQRRNLYLLSTEDGR
jgi:hypothetical protein